MGWISYMSGSMGQAAYDVKAQVLVYADAIHNGRVYVAAGAGGLSVLK